MRLSEYGIQVRVIHKIAICKAWNITMTGSMILCCAVAVETVRISHNLSLSPSFFPSDQKIIDCIGAFFM